MVSNNASAAFPFSGGSSEPEAEYRNLENRILATPADELSVGLELEDFIEENGEAQGEGDVEAKCGTDPELPGLGYYTCEYEEGIEIRFLRIELDQNEIKIIEEK
jgi:hypothetical protein